MPIDSITTATIVANPAGPAVETRGGGCDWTITGFQTIEQALRFLNYGELDPGTADDPNLWPGLGSVPLTWAPAPPERHHQ